MAAPPPGGYYYRRVLKGLGPLGLRVVYTTLV